VSGFDAGAALRRIRRLADVSQRELAERIGISKSTLAAVESGSRGLDARVLACAAEVAGLSLALLDENGDPVEGMAADGVRDRIGRRFPAHLDTRYSDEGWWHGPERYSRPAPWYTFDRDRERRDAWRATCGTPSDHQLPRRGDSPAERAAARRQAARLRGIEKAKLRPEEPFDCSCPPGCDELDDRSGPPVHAPGCPCGCDIG
jgi:transcriptional regulator with XRE-family HTH domain